MWGCGMPWNMGFMPVFFVIAIVCMFFFFRRGFEGGCHKTDSAELAEEVRRLRQEVEELRKDSKK